MSSRTVVTSAQGNGEASSRQPAIVLETDPLDDLLYFRNAAEPLQSWVSDEIGEPRGALLGRAAQVRHRLIDFADASRCQCQVGARYIVAGIDLLDEPPRVSHPSGAGVGKGKIGQYVRSPAGNRRRCLQLGDATARIDLRQRYAGHEPGAFVM